MGHFLWHLRRFFKLTVFFPNRPPCACFGSLYTKLVPKPVLPASPVRNVRCVRNTNSKAHFTSIEPQTLVINPSNLYSVVVFAEE